ncbi:hypothetical protein A2U01_0079726, partial [Trifolium medium]|nr:hypothetical protein [Trifolium medium]
LLSLEVELLSVDPEVEHLSLHIEVELLSLEFELLSVDLEVEHLSLHPE